MKTAVFLTGQERGFHRVVGLLRKNLLENNDVVLFLAVETADPGGLYAALEGIQIGGALCPPTFRSEHFNRLLFMAEMHEGVSETVFQRARDLDGVPWTFNYLKQSGTVLQYYQLWKAWGLMLEYERTMDMRFDTCVRLRTDSILTERLDMSFFANPPTDEIALRSLGTKRIPEMISADPAICLPPLGSVLGTRRIWTFGLEQFWIGPRDVFESFGPMVFQYGLWDAGAMCNFNSETFFEQFCLHNSITRIALSYPGMLNTSHPGNDPVTEDPVLYSFLR